LNYVAQLDGFELILKSDGTEDTWEKNLAEYDIPFAQGANLDPLGVRSHPIRFTCIFMNNKYAEHEFFVQHCLLDIVNTFIHPVYGPIKGCVKSVSVRNNSLIKYAEVDVDFVEDASPDTAPAYSPDVKTKTEQAVADAQVVMMAKVSDDIKQALGQEGSDIVSKELAPGQSSVSQFSRLSTKGRYYLQKVDDLINTFDKSLPGISNPSDSVFASFDFGLTLPGRIMFSMSRSVERYAQYSSLAANSPLSFINSFRSSMAELTSSVTFFKSSLLSSICQVGAIVMAALFEKDDSNRNDLTRVENTKIWNDDGTMVFVPEIPTVLTVNELETSLALYRTQVQEAINEIRTEYGNPDLISSLKSIAISLQEHVDKIKIEREKVITIQIDNEIPVHLLCLKYGLSYMAAERVCAINTIWNPTFCSGPVAMYVR
jgi:hypothetical protein